MTTKDVAGNPTDPVFNTAIYSDTFSVRTRSIFTDRGPIAKPPLVVQSGVGATVSAISEVTLPGASLTSNHVGLYITLGYMGTVPTSSSLVVGHSLTIADTISAPDSLKIETLRASTTKIAYTTLSGTYKILGVPSSTRAKLQASFTLPQGPLYWQLIDPQNGQIADDPGDVVVRVNGIEVVPDAVIGLLGQVVLPLTPGPTDDVKVDYRWCSNPTVDIRRLNSKEFKLNSWNRNNVFGGDPNQHKYQYNNVLVRPGNYITLSTLAKQIQPKARELHYRALERAYSAVTNDPTSLVLNSPTHKIAFPAAQRRLAEEFVVYESNTLPEDDLNPWIRQGVGLASVTAGVLTVTDNTSGPFPTGQSIFWTKSIDLTFPNAFALSWRMLVSSVSVYEGVFSGVAAGYSDSLQGFVVGFLEVGGVKKIGFLKKACGNTPHLESSWTGGLDSIGMPTGLPIAFDWGILHSYRIFKDISGVVHLLVDGDVVDSLKVSTTDVPFLEELNSSFKEIQGVFFGSLSRVAENVSNWDFFRYLTIPTNAIQTGPSSFVSYEGTVNPEVDVKPWTPIGYHGTETLLGGTLLLDSTSATDAGTANQVGLIGGDFKGFVRIEPLLLSASQVVLDAQVQLRTQTHGIDPYGLMFAIDDGSRLIQVSFLASLDTPKFSYGGRSLPEDFSPYSWSSLGSATAEMVGRTLRITDSTTASGKVYFIDDLAPSTSDSRVIDASTDYFLEFRCKVNAYTADPSGFIGAFGQISDGTRAVGILLEDIGGTKYVALQSEGVTLTNFAFDWGNDFHTYRLVKNTFGNLVTLFIDGAFIGSFVYASFSLAPGVAQVSFGSATAASVLSTSTVDWAYCNAWRSRGDIKRYVGIWKGFDDHSFTGYHLPLKVSGSAAQIMGNALGDVLADFPSSNVTPGDLLVVDVGLNKGTYTVAGISSSTTLTIVGTWPTNPSEVSYRILKPVDWASLHKYRISKDASGEVDLMMDSQTTPLIRIGYNSVDLPDSGVGIVKTVSHGLASIVFGSFSPENIEQSNWDFVRYGVTRVPTEMRAVPHHQVTNQWNVMESPERLTSNIPHTLTSYKSSSTGTVPKTDPDFLENPGLTAFTQLNADTPLVPSTQTIEVRGTSASLTNISTLLTPSDVLDNEDFTLNDGVIQYHLILPNDILYSSLEVIEQATGDNAVISPFSDEIGFTGLNLNYQKTTCLVYGGTTLPENDSTASTPWTRRSDIPSEVLATVLGGVLTYRTVGSKTVYLNNTPLPDAPGLITEARFRLRLTQDATLGTGDTKVRFGLSAPGLTVALAFVTTANVERYVIVVDLNTGAYLGSVSFDFLDGAFHTYHIVRDPGAGVVQISIDP